MQFQFRFVEAGHVVEADLTLLFRIELGSALTERHRPVVAALHLVRMKSQTPTMTIKVRKCGGELDHHAGCGWRLTR